TAVHAERIATALAGPQSGIVLVDDLEAGIAVVNAYAAEHLEIQTEDAAGVAGRITNAGAIFVGPYSPVPLGRSEEHTSELQSRFDLVCRLLLEKKKTKKQSRR